MVKKGAPKTPGSGRKKGTPNKDSFPVQQLAEQMGVNPMQILLLVIKRDWKALGYDKGTVTKKTNYGEEYEVELITLEHRIDCASEVAQYLYPKRKALELSPATSDSPGIKIIIEDFGKK